MKDSFWLGGTDTVAVPPRLPDVEVVTEGKQTVRFDFYPELDTPEILASELVAQGVIPDSPGLPGRIHEAVTMRKSATKVSESMNKYKDRLVKASFLASGRLLDSLSQSLSLDRQTLETFLGLEC